MENLEDLFEATDVKVRKRKQLDEMVFESDDFTIDFRTVQMRDDQREEVINNLLNWGQSGIYIKDFKPGTVIDSNEIPTPRCVTETFDLTSGQSVTIIRSIRKKLHLVIRDRQKRNERGDFLVKLQRAWLKEDETKKALKVFFNEKNQKKRDKRILLDSVKPEPDG